MKKNEQMIGWIGALLVLVLGKMFLETDMLFFRLIIGLGIGYTLTRSYAGFAGSANRAFNAGSTKLMRSLMGLFFISALLTIGLLFNTDPTTYGLKIHPINFGLIVGGTMFGFGMAFSSCCASGVLTDLVTGLPRAFVTLIFFGMGVFLGFPLQAGAGWVKDSWLSTPVGEVSGGGVYLPDLFQWDGAQGYLGSIILTGLLCLLVVYIAYKYEQGRKANNTYNEIPVERMQDEKDNFDTKDYKFFSEENYNRIFIKPWTLAQGFLGMSVVHILLMGVTKQGWGVSSPFGIWFGKFLMIFGVSAESIASFTMQSADKFSTSLFTQGSSVQNFGILLGTIIYLLMAGLLKETFFSELKITGKEVLLYAVGGFAMGFGTRLAQGCNAGGLFTPIANFSLSGWLFLIVMVLGSFMGTTLFRKLNN